MNRALLAIVAFALVALIIAVSVDFDEVAQTHHAPLDSPVKHGLESAKLANPEVQKRERVTEADAVRSATLGEPALASDLETVRTLRVVIRAETFDGLRTQGVSGVALEIGVARMRALGGTVLLRGETGADSYFRGDVGLPKMGPGMRLLVRSVEPGFKRKRHWYKIRDNQDEFEVDLRMELGCSLTGRVLGPDGEPESGARVILRMDEPRSGTFPLDWFDRTDSNGRFELHFGREGTGYVRAQKRGVGNALLDAVDFSMACTREDPIEFHLRGPGRLKGRVINPDGEPYKSLDLRVRTASDPTVYWHDETDHQGRGVLADSCTTTDSGEFDFTGLEDGAYEFLTFERSELVPLTPLKYHTNSGEIELVARVHELDLVVEQHDGSIIEKVDSFSVQAGTVRPTLRCEWKLNSESEMPWNRLQPINSMKRGIGTLFSVEPGWRIRFATSRVTGRTEFQELTVGDSDWLITRTLRLPEPKPMAIVEFAMMTPDGMRAHTVSAAVEDQAGNTISFEDLVSSTTSRITVPLPAGRYQLLARGRQEAGHLYARVPFDLVPGEQRTLTVQLQTAGRLALSVTAEELPSEPRLEEAYKKSRDWEPESAGSWPYLANAGIRLVRERSLPTAFTHPKLLRSGKWVPLGHTAEFDHAFEPGEHKILLEYPGYKPVLKSVTIDAGQTTKISVALTLE